MELIIRNVKLPRQNPYAAGKTVDIGVDNGTFSAVQPGVAETGKTEIDGRGSIISPPFIDPHIHLDAVLVELVYDLAAENGTPGFNHVSFR